MSDSNGDEDTVLYELEVEVRAELTLAEGGESAREGIAPIEEWLVDPQQAELEAVMFRSLLGAVEVLEEERERRRSEG